VDPEILALVGALAAALPAAATALAKLVQAWVIRRRRVTMTIRSPDGVELTLSSQPKPEELERWLAALSERIDADHEQQAAELHDEVS
jgi:hypothetical protein